MRLGAVLALAMALASCRKAAPPRAQEPHQILEGFSMSQSRGGSPSWNLASRTATLSEDSQTASLSRPEMEFFKEGKPASRARALAGQVRTDTHDVRLSSSVVLTSLEDSSVLTTEEMLYSSKRGLFLTDREVVVRRPGGVLRGRGFQAKPDLSELRVFNQTSVIEGKRK